MNENNPIIYSVIEKLHKQQEKGLQKYGVEVETSSHDLKGWLRHAQEEAIDFATYLETAIQLLEEQVKSKKEEMKFYEVNEPYYALIKAKSKENAGRIYDDNVADDGDKLAISEVTETYAAIRHSRTVGEDGKPLSVKEVLEDMTSDNEMVLGRDGNLV
ncbi:hypothetical protein ABEO51_07945 [Bacillus safensis]